METFFDEVRIAPFDTKFAPYCQAAYALRLRRSFELTFSSFAGVSPDVNIGPLDAFAVDADEEQFVTPK